MQSDAAAAGYRRALKCGLPIFAAFLSMLAAGVDRYQIQHDRVPLSPGGPSAAHRGPPLDGLDSGGRRAGQKIEPATPPAVGSAPG